MKNKFSNSRLSYFFIPRIHGYVLAWIKHAPESERSKCAMENILRWEDDGGKMLDLGSHPTRLYPDAARKRRKKMNVSGTGKFLETTTQHLMYIKLLGAVR